MHNPHIQKLLIDSRLRELKSDMASVHARQAISVARPRRWRLRSALAPSIARFAI